VIDVAALDSGLLKFMVVVTVVVCIAAVVDSRFRKACLGLLCRLGGLA
jgi:hypothetical protein